jgi:hypothetical protein
VEVVLISKISGMLSRSPCSSVSSFIRHAATTRATNSSTNPIASLVGSAERIDCMTSPNGTTRKMSSSRPTAADTVSTRVSVFLVSGLMQVRRYGNWASTSLRVGNP